MGVAASISTKSDVVKSSSLLKVEEPPIILKEPKNNDQNINETNSIETQKDNKVNETTIPLEKSIHVGTSTRSKYISAARRPSIANITKLKSVRSIRDMALFNHSRQENTYIPTESIQLIFQDPMDAVPKSLTTHGVDIKAESKTLLPVCSFLLTNEGAKVTAAGGMSVQIASMRIIESSELPRKKSIANDSHDTSSVASRPKRKPLLNIAVENDDEADWVPVSDSDDDVDIKRGDTDDVQDLITPLAPLQMTHLDSHSTNAHTSEILNSHQNDSHTTDGHGRKILNKYQSYLFTKSGTIFIDGFTEGIGKDGILSIAHPASDKNDLAFHLDDSKHGKDCLDSEVEMDIELKDDRDSNIALATVTGEEYGFSAWKLPINERLVIICKLGQGASSVVYKALDLVTMKLVAVKMIPVFERGKRRQMVRELSAMFELLRKKQELIKSNQASSTSLFRSILRDHELLNKRPSDCIVDFYDAFSNIDEGRVALMMEYMDGGSLQDIVDHGGCDDEQTLANIALQCLYGLTFLHTNHQLHRDLKPSNFLLSHNGEVKVADLGIMKQLNTSSEDEPSDSHFIPTIGNPIQRSRSNSTSSVNELYHSYRIAKQNSFHSDIAGDDLPVPSSPSKAETESVHASLGIALDEESHRSIHQTNYQVTSSPTKPPLIGTSTNSLSIDNSLSISTSISLPPKRKLSQSTSLHENQSSYRKGSISYHTTGLNISITTKEEEKTSTRSYDNLIPSPRLYKTHTFVGTATYMSPERIDGKEYSFPSDIWGVGLSLMSVCMGQLPYDVSGGYWSILSSIRDDDLINKLPNKFSSSFRSFLHGCLERKPEKRLSIPQLLQHPFLKNAIHIPISPRKFTPRISLTTNCNKEVDSPLKIDDDANDANHDNDVNDYDRSVSELFDIYHAVYLHLERLKTQRHDQINSKQSSCIDIQSQHKISSIKTELNELHSQVFFGDILKRSYQDIFHRLCFGVFPMESMNTNTNTNANTNTNTNANTNTNTNAIPNPMDATKMTRGVSVSLGRQTQEVDLSNYEKHMLTPVSCNNHEGLPNRLAMLSQQLYLSEDEIINKTREYIASISPK